MTLTLTRRLPQGRGKPENPTLLCVRSDAALVAPRRSRLLCRLYPLSSFHLLRRRRRQHVVLVVFVFVVVTVVAAGAACVVEHRYGRCLVIRVQSCYGCCRRTPLSSSSTLSGNEVPCWLWIALSASVEKKSFVTVVIFSRSSSSLPRPRCIVVVALFCLGRLWTCFSQSLSVTAHTLSVRTHHIGLRFYMVAERG